MNEENTDYLLLTVNQVRENLILMTQHALANWVEKQKGPFTIGDIYKDPTINGDLYANREMIKAIKEALIRLGCKTLYVSDLDVRFLPPSLVSDIELLAS